MSKLINAIEMVNYLSIRNVVSLQELSDHLEVSVRAVQRLKDTLLDAGFDIDVLRGPQGGYVLNSKRHNLNTELSIEEIKLVKQGLSYLVKSDIAQGSLHLSKAISKLSSSIDGYGIDAVNSYQSIRLNVDPVIYQNHIELLDEAIAKTMKIHITYRKNHFEKNEYVFEPYNLVIVNSFWYINGFDEKGRYLSLKINRIENLKHTDNTFLKDESMIENSISQFGYRINPVRLVCMVERADFISEYIWGKNQTIEWVEDGSFKLDVEFQNENAVKDFVLRHGRSLQVLEPSYLIDWLLDEMEVIKNKYK